MAGETRHHRGRQPHRRPGAALHPVGCGRRELHRRVDAAHLRPADQRVEGRRGAVPQLLGLAAGGGERRRVAPARHAGDRLRAGSRQRQLRDPRGREAHGLRDRRRRGRPEPEVRHRQGHQGLAAAAAAAAAVGGSGGGDDPWATGGSARAARAAARAAASGGRRLRAAASSGGRAAGRRPAAAPPPTTERPLGGRPAAPPTSPPF